MIEKEKLIQAIFKGIREFNEQQPEDQHLTESLDTVLFGRSGILDSLGLVNFIIAIEEQLEDEFDITLILTDEKAMSQKNSPFKTIETLVEYITKLMMEMT
jgi:D-alanine--poly(phosphoribitol) ligase subunit 2